MRLDKLGIAVGVTVAILAGCGVSDEDQPVAARPVMPEGWQPTTEDRRLLDQAEQVLAGGCMRKLGFKYWVDTRRLPPAWTFPYVIDDPAWARTNGYGGARQRQINAAVKADPNARYAETLSPARQQAYRMAFFGSERSAVSARTPDGVSMSTGSQGCLADARRQLFGDLQTWFAGDTVEVHLDLVVVPKTQADARYRKALAAWSRCAHPAGSPDDLRRTAADRVRNKRPQVADHVERRLASLEARCAVTSGLGRVARAVDAHFRVRAEREFAGSIKPLRAMQYAALPKATELVGRPAGANR